MLQTKVVYRDTEKIEKLLGEKGLPLLQAALALIQEKATRENWPLNQIIVYFYQDPEDKDWQFAHVLLDFNADFETSNGHLESLYLDIDNYATMLDKKSREMLLTLIHYDIKLI